MTAAISGLMIAVAILPLGITSNRAGLRGAGPLLESLQTSVWAEKRKEFQWVSWREDRKSTRLNSSHT